MLELKDLTFTHDVDKQHVKELLYKIFSNPDNIVDFTFSPSHFMLSAPEPTQKQIFKKFDLGEIKGTLGRKDLYEDR